MATQHFTRRFFSGLLSLSLLVALVVLGVLTDQAAVEKRKKQEKVYEVWHSFTDEHCLEHFNRSNGWLMAYCDDGKAYVKAFTGRNGLYNLVPENLPSLLRGDYDRVPLPEKVPKGVFEGMKDTDFMKSFIVGARPRLRSVGQSWVNPPRPVKEM